VYHSRNDPAVITLTGFDFRSFEWLSSRFQLFFDSHSPFIDENGLIAPLPEREKRQGRPRLISATDCLGLVLAWTRTRGSTMVLQIIFGMTSTPVSMYLKFGRRILIKVLSKEPSAAIRIPDVDTIMKYQQVIQNRHPNLQGVWCTMDGLKLYLQQAGEASIQNNFYNGWTHDHYVSNVIVFCPDGTIPICCYNVPGSVHDSMVAEWGGVYEKLGRVHRQTGGMCTVDSAFSKRNYPYLIKSAQNGGVGETPEQFAANVRLNAEATSMRQSAEWGMRALQSSFPRLKDRFIYEEYGERKIILKTMLLLYNLRARKVGINQIKNTYMPALEANANEMFVHN
jgi:DDE superfamily endonuclease